METLLISIIYCLMAGITYSKQLPLMDEDFISPEGACMFLAVFWWITIPIYIIKSVFFNKWIKQ